MLIIKNILNTLIKKENRLRIKEYALQF